MTTADSKSANRGRIIFGYDDSYNDAYHYWFVDFSASGVFELKQMNGKNNIITHATFDNADSALDITSYVTVNIRCTEDGLLMVKLYQDDAEYDLVSNYNSGVIKGETGLGVSNCAITKFDNYIVTYN